MGLNLAHKKHKEPGQKRVWSEAEHLTHLPLLWAEIKMSVHFATIAQMVKGGQDSLVFCLKRIL